MMKKRRFRYISMVLGLLVLALSIPTGGLAQSVSSAAVPSAAGDPFPIATVPGNQEHAPAVACDEGRNHYLVVYQNNGGMNALCIDGQGTTVAAYVVPASYGQRPDVTYSADHDEYLIVWDEGGDIYGARVGGVCYGGPGGISSAFLISGDRPGTESSPAVAYNNHANHQDYLVVWEDTNNQSNYWAVFGRWVTDVGVSGSSLAIANTSGAWNYEPDVAYNLNMNEYLVVYTHDASKGTAGGARDIYGRRVYNTGGGGLLAEYPIDSSANDQDSPSVAAYRLNYTTPYLVVYRDFWNDAAGDVRGYLVSTGGQSVALLNIADVPGLQESEPGIAASESRGGYTVVWSQGTVSSDIYGRRVSGDGFVGSTFGVDLGSSEDRVPVVASGSSAPLAVWQTWNGSDWDVYGRFLYRRVYLPVVVRNFP
ncbi:MAG: hypothetical protein PVH17_09000 [Anaerolineae bacterium]